VNAYAERYAVDHVEAARRLRLQWSATGIVDKLRREIGLGFGGVWFDHDEGRFHVALATGDEDALESVTEFLGERGLANDTDVRHVRWSYAELVDAASRVGGRLGRRDRMAVAPDVERNGIQIRISREAAAPAHAAADRVRAGSEMPVRIVSTAPELFDIGPAACSWPSCSRPLRGSVRIHNLPTGIHCTAGFPAYVPGSPGPDRHILTAGHCTRYAGTWYAYRTGPGTVESIGPSAGVVFNAWGDVGTVRVNGQWNGVLHPMVAAWDVFGGVINDAHAVSDRASSYVGLFGCRFGQTTPFHCGTVTLLDYPVTYSGVTVETLTLTDTCAEPGDSGGPWMSGNIAYGIVAAASLAGCTGGPDEAMLYSEVVDAEGFMGIRLITQATGAI
jgi:streptogrisin C